jgi:hypothetical protein
LLGTPPAIPTINPNLKAVKVERIRLATLAADVKPIIPTSRHAIATLCGPTLPKYVVVIIVRVL